MVYPASADANAASGKARVVRCPILEAPPPASRPGPYCPPSVAQSASRPSGNAEPCQQGPRPMCPSRGAARARKEVGRSRQLLVSAKPPFCGQYQSARSHGGQFDLADLSAKGGAGAKSGSLIDCGLCSLALGHVSGDNCVGVEAGLI